MKTIIVLICLIVQGISFSQIDNQNYNQTRNIALGGVEKNIHGDVHNMTIITEVIYNAVPDGYQITYTKSFIAKTVEDTEKLLSMKSDSIVNAVKEIGLQAGDVVFDIIALDPVFDFQQRDSIAPSGFKVTENIVFNIKDFSKIPRLAEICLHEGLYDLINAQAYLEDAKPIYEEMNTKMVELVNQKKKLCKGLGANIDNAKVIITQLSDTYYPSERYLKSILQNARFYQHHLSQNSSLAMNRTVEIDNYFDYNLKQADFVFNPNNTQPVIQFYSQVVTEYVTPDTEEEIRKKVEEELKAKNNSKPQVIYTIDGDGNLKKIDL